MLGWQRWVETHSTPARHFIVMEKHKEAKRTVFENKDRNEKKIVVKNIKTHGSFIPVRRSNFHLCLCCNIVRDQITWVDNTLTRPMADSSLNISSVCRARWWWAGETVTHELCFSVFSLTRSVTLGAVGSLNVALISTKPFG